MSNKTDSTTISATIQKPLILEINEAEQETLSAVNEIMKKHNLPCSLYEPIISGIHRQLVDGKKNEIQMASAQYAKDSAEPVSK